MPDTNMRPRYFDGQFLTEKDFNLAQDYILDRVRRHQKQLHTPGIAEGLNIAVGIGDAAAKVAVGTAVDGLGRQIVLGEERTLALGAPFASKTVLLVIAYVETASNKASAGVQENTRWLESPDVKVVDATAPLEDNNVRLASLKLDSAGKVTAIDLSVRRTAGIHPGSELEARKLTLSRDGLASSSWPSLTCGAAGELQVGGTLTVGPGKSAAEAVSELRLTAQESDFASLISNVKGTVTTLTLTVGDDSEDSINLTTVGWQAGQRGPINLRAGNITLELEAVATRTLSVVDSAAKPLLTVRNDGNVGVGTADPIDKLHIGGGNLRLDAGTKISFADNGTIRSFDDNHSILFRRTENKLEIREYGDLIFSPGATAGKETAKVVMRANGDVAIVGNLVQEKWTNAVLQPGWTMLEPADKIPAGYLLEKSGMLRLRGVLKKDPPTTPDASIFEILRGLRPLRKEVFCVTTLGGAGRLEIRPTSRILSINQKTGEVRTEFFATVHLVAGSPNGISLDGITFQTAADQGFVDGSDSPSTNT